MSEAPNPIVIVSDKAKVNEHHPDSPHHKDENKAARNERKRRLGFLIFLAVDALLLLILM